MFGVRSAKKTKVSSPRAKASGMSKFPHAPTPRAQPLKTRIYTKAILREDASQFFDFGAHPELLGSPSIVGMTRKPRR